MAPSPAAEGLRARLRRGDILLGAFLKTPTRHGAKIPGGLGFDCMVVGGEHSPFGRRSTDAALFAARATAIVHSSGRGFMKQAAGKALAEIRVAGAAQHA